MMQWLVLLAAVMAGIHALTYAVWLKEQGNRPGAWLVTAVTSAVLGLTAWRTFMQ